MCNMNSQMLGELEKEIMEVMWANKQPRTVRIVYEAISRRRKIAYTTVMTIMGRLTKKGFLKTEVSGKAYTYQTSLSKDKFLTKISRQMIKNLVSTFGDVALAHFAKELEKIPVDKRQKLVKLLKDANAK